MSVADKVRDYVDSSPYISEALERGIANQSELARVIQQELGIDRPPAIKAALRRYTLTIQENRHNREEQVKRIFSTSRLMLLDNHSIVITDTEINIPSKMKVKLTDGNSVYLVETANLPGIEAEHGTHVRKTHRDTTALVINSPEYIEEIPGVIAFLMSLLASHGVSTLAFTCCYTETTIVVHRDDALKSYQILSKIIGR